MRIITREGFFDLIKNPQTKVLKTLKKQPKILEIPGDIIVKVFYPKWKWYYRFIKKVPPAISFCENAEKLNALGISTPNVLKIEYCKGDDVYLVYYKKAPGKNVDITFSGKKSDFIKSLATFIAKIHESGIYFRGIHLENIVNKGTNFALIDFSNVKFRKNALTLSERYRNLKHLFTYNKNKADWTQEKIIEFLQSYNKDITLTNRKMIRLGERILALVSS